MPAGAEGPDSPAHNHVFPQWVRGWCAYAWIIWQPGHGAPPLTDKAHLMHLAGPGPLHPPSQSQLDRVVEEFRAANQILWQGCKIAFQVCDVILLDASALLSGPIDDRTSLADLFADSGALEMGGEAGDRFLNTLADIVQNFPSPEFNRKMRKPCVHIFFTHDVTDTSDPNQEQGVGGVFGPAAAPISYGIVDAGSPVLAQTIVHEIVHSLGVEEHSTDPESVFQESIGPDDVKLDSNLCETLLDYLERRIAVACP